MFLGHFGVAFAAKRAEPRLSLATLFLASQFLDVLWPLFLLLGWEHAVIEPGHPPATPIQFTDYPISHSLVGALAWSFLVMAIYYSWPTRDIGHHRRRTLVVGAAVWSHWLLDLIVHVPDLPLAGNDSLKLGLGLWRSLPATLTVESLVFGAGVALYLTGSSRRHPIRLGRVIVLVVVLAGVFLAATLGPPPPSIAAVAWSGLGLVPLLILLGLWADRGPPPPTASRRTRQH